MLNLVGLKVSCIFELVASGAKILESMKGEIQETGFAIIEKVFSDTEIENIISTISNAENSKETFRKTNDLFAIRQFFKEIPTAFDKVFNDKLKNIISELFGNDFFVVKSIYFDKSENSNWFVSYHQDLTISVDKKLEIENFGP